MDLLLNHKDYEINDLSESGATATVVIRRNEEILVGNVGDVQAIAVSKGK